MMISQRRRILHELAAAAAALLLPVPKASAQAAPAFRVGDRYRYRRLDPYSGAEQNRYTTEVTQVTDSEVIFSDGRILDRRGHVRRLPDGSMITMLQAPRGEFSPGMRWQTRFLITLPSGVEIPAEMDGRVLERETIAVPAGTFEALRFEGRGLAHAPLGVVRTELRVYRAPGLVRMPLVREEIRRNGRGMVFFAERHELVGYHQS